MIRRLVLVAWLVFVWLELWGDVSVANVLSGLALGTVLVVAFPVRKPDAPTVVRPLRALVFGAWYLVQLVQANATVAWTVIRPKGRVNEAIVAVPLQPSSDGLTALIANAVSLTPGTLSVEVWGDPPILYVHVLDLADPATTRAEVRAIETRARAAFAPRPEVAP